MPPRSRAAAHPLDLDDARRRLAEGRIVRVGISRSAQFPEGGTGRIRHIGDPEVDGEEYVQVEVSLNGTKDVLPFTPTDLSPARRAPRSTGPERDAVTSTQARPPRRPAGRPRRAAGTTGGSPSPAADGGPGPSPADPPATGAEPGPPAEPVVPGPLSDAAGPATSRTSAMPEPSTAASTAPAPRRRPTRAPGRRAPAVSIAIATADGEPPQWRLDVRVGARAAVRAATLSAAQVWRLVEALGEEAVTAAVNQVLDEQRQAATRRAEALAAELAAVRAELESLPGG